MTGSAPAGLRRGLGGTNPLARFPRLYLALARRRYGDRVLGPETDILIEGYPRSANTFAVAAFELAQERPVTVAHHLHVAAHVVAAVEAGVPVILLVRRPAEAIASVIARKPSVAPELAARTYLRFYDGVRDVLDGCVGGVRRCGRRLRSRHRADEPRYGTRSRPSSVPRRTSPAASPIEAQNRARAGRDGLRCAAVARPQRARGARRRARVQALPPSSPPARLYEATVKLQLRTRLPGRRSSGTCAPSRRAG